MLQRQPGIFNPAAEADKRSLPHLFFGDVHGGQRGLNQKRTLYIIKADDRDILSRPDVQKLQSAVKTYGCLIIAADPGCGKLAKGLYFFYQALVIFLNDCGSNGR